MNVAEKIFARHMNSGAASGEIKAVKPGDVGFANIDLRFSHEAVTPMASMFFERSLGPDASIKDPASVVFFRDHFVLLDQSPAEAKTKLGLLDLAQHLTSRQEQFAKTHGVKLHGDLMHGGSEGICHSLVLQRYALPGQLIVGSDSHTPHSGAIGAIAFGIGTTEVFNAWFTKDIRICVPQTVKVVVQGKWECNSTAKDFILAILSTDYVRSGQAVGKIIEYAGAAVAALSVDERATLTNMAAEIGGFTGIVAPDQKVVDFLVERRGLLRGDCERMVEGLTSDPGAEYAHIIEIDAGKLAPMIAAPGDPGNGLFIRELGKPVRVDIAYGGSCTAGKNDDMDMYATVLADALQQGKRVADGVQFYIQFGSVETREYSRAKGYLEIFEKAGVD
jgi:3-isopropylmalate/(R)-2-methylmalate dehydratase large subunit